MAYQFFEFSLRNQRLLFCLTTLLFAPPTSPNPYWGKYTIGASDGGCGRCRQHPQPSDWGQNGICSKNRTMTVAPIWLIGCRCGLRWPALALFCAVWPLWVSGGADGVAVKLAASGGMLWALARWLISSIHIFMNRAPVLAGRGRWAVSNSPPASKYARARVLCAKCR